MKIDLNLDNEEETSLDLADDFNNEMVMNIKRGRSHSDQISKLFEFSSQDFMKSPEGKILFEEHDKTAQEINDKE